GRADPRWPAPGEPVGPGRRPRPGPVVQVCRLAPRGDGHCRHVLDEGLLLQAARQASGLISNPCEDFSMPSRSRNPLVWCLGGLGLLLNLASVYLACDLLPIRETAAPVPPAQLAVPYEEDPRIWEPYRRWVIQEDGRCKPCDPFCRDWARAIPGGGRRGRVRSPLRGHLLAKGHDPVAVVVSWMLDEPAGAACDWEHYPFILCPNP